MRAAFSVSDLYLHLEFAIPKRCSTFFKSLFLPQHDFHHWYSTPAYFHRPSLITSFLDEIADFRTPLGHLSNQLACSKSNNQCYPSINRLKHQWLPAAICASPGTMPMSAHHLVPLISCAVFSTELRGRLALRPLFPV